MIAGATRGAGGPALGRHLANAEKNERVVVLESRGLVSVGIRDQIAELTRLGSHARTRTPLYHVHASPPPDRPWTPDERTEYWRAFEQEFGLEDRPFAAVIHLKDGREHEHKVYRRARADGTAIRLDHDHARREKLGRAFEFGRGETLTPGAHNRAVIAALDREGRADVAQAMRAAGLDTVARPRAPTTPGERAQGERTGVDPTTVAAAALAAWRASDGAAAFQVALIERGLRLAQGDKVAVIVDASGAPHALAKLLGKESKAGGDDRINAAEVRTRLAGLDLVPVDQVAALQQAAPGTAPPVSAALQDVPAAAPTPPQGGDHASGSELADPAPPAEADLVGRPDFRDDGGHAPGRPDPGRPLHDGLQRYERDVVRGAPDSPPSGEPDAAPGPAGPAGAGGADADRPGDRASGGHRGGADQDGGAHGRARVQARRALHGLAAAAGSRTDRLAELTAALRRPPTPAGMLAAALAASDERAVQVLAGGPWPDPRTRSAGLIASDLHDDRMNASRGADLRAQAARAEADAARGRIGILDRLVGIFGVRTAAVRDLEKAEARAVQAKAACDGGRELRGDLARLNARARAVARGREAEREDWSHRPEVVAARREMEGNAMVRAAIAAGDFRIVSLAAVDLAAAREALLRREAEQPARTMHLGPRSLDLLRRRPNRMNEAEQEPTRHPSMR